MREFPIRTARTRKRSRAALLSFLVMFAGAQAVLGGLLEFGPVGLRDPEFAVRASRLQAIRAQYPGRSLCVAFGSSRMAEGLRPAILPESDQTVFFNFGLIGAAPVTQKLALERLLNSGVRPDAVILEYWPPYLFESRGEREEDRLDANRLARSDWPIVGHYLRDPHAVASQVRLGRLLSAWSHRFVILNLFVHVWLPFERRQEFRWRPVDDSGWLPGKDGDTKNRAAHLAMSRQYYARFLAAGSFDPVGEQAFEDLLRLCQARGIPATLLWLPESSEFRSWYSPEAERIAQLRFRQLGSLPGVRMLDARSWIDDDRLGDGFHLDPAGAGQLTARLADTLRICP